MYHYMNYDFTALDIQWTEMLDYLLFSGEDLVFVRAHFVRAFVFFLPDVCTEFVYFSIRIFHLVIIHLPFIPCVCPKTY